MRQISLVGAVDEEVGDYFPEFLDMLEESPFLKVSVNANYQSSDHYFSGHFLLKSINIKLTLSNKIKFYPMF